MQRQDSFVHVLAAKKAKERRRTAETCDVGPSGNHKAIRSASIAEGENEKSFESFVPGQGKLDDGGVMKRRTARPAEHEVGGGAVQPHRFYSPVLNSSKTYAEGAATEQVILRPQELPGAESQRKHLNERSRLYEHLASMDDRVLRFLIPAKSVPSEELIRLYSTVAPPSMQTAIRALIAEERASRDSVVEQERQQRGYIHALRVAQRPEATSRRLLSGDGSQQGPHSVMQREKECLVRCIMDAVLAVRSKSRSTSHDGVSHESKGMAPGAEDPRNMDHDEELFSLIDEETNVLHVRLTPATPTSTSPWSSHEGDVSETNTEIGLCSVKEASSSTTFVTLTPDLTNGRRQIFRYLEAHTDHASSMKLSAMSDDQAQMIGEVLSLFGKRFVASVDAKGGNLSASEWAMMTMLRPLTGSDWASGSLEEGDDVWKDIPKLVIGEAATTVLRQYIKHAVGSIGERFQQHRTDGRSSDGHPSCPLDIR
jgi:hypothetical protein